MSSTVAPAASRRPTRAYVVIGAALAVIAAIGGTLVWRTVDELPGPPRELGARVGGFDLIAAPAPVGSATLQVGFMSPYDGKEDGETLTFRSATAHFRRNSADAVATVSVCLPRQTSKGSLGGGGTVQSPTPKEFCREVRPVGPGTRMRWGTESGGGEYLVLTIHPTRAGVADVDSFTLDYVRYKHHGGAHQVERLGGQKFVVRAR